MGRGGKLQPAGSNKRAARTQRFLTHQLCCAIELNKCSLYFIVCVYCYNGHSYTHTQLILVKVIPPDVNRMDVVHWV